MKFTVKENRFKVVLIILFLLVISFISYHIPISNTPEDSNKQNENSEKDLNQNKIKPEEEIAPLADSEDAKIIKEYYAFLSVGKLKEAFAMRTTENVSFDEFSNWYNNIEYANPDNFRYIGDNTYDFIVSYKERASDARNYSVRMAVVEGKIKTISSKEFEAATVEFEGYTAFSTIRGDKIYLILEQANIEDIVDVGDYSRKAIDSGFSDSFSDFKFSPKGNYLMYSTNNWEYVATEIYDIKNRKKVGKIIDYESFIGVVPGDGIDFTPDEKYVYYCLGNGFWAGVPGEVYSVPTFNTIFRAMDKIGSDSYMESVCEYKNDKKAIVFTLSDPYKGEGPETRIIEYSLEN